MADGKDLIRRLRQLLNEDSDSGWLDTQTSYDWLYDAAGEFADRTGCLRAEQEITTVADQTAYNINPDFLRLYLKNSSGNFYVKYYDTASYTFPTFKEYEDVYYQNNTTSVSVPGRFSIIDAALPSQVTGSATATSASSGGQCTLNGAGFGDVDAGATVHNTTDGSSGMVLSKTSSALVAGYHL